VAQIALRGLSKSFAETPAVVDVDLDIADRSFHTLLGPSGCGKTSTLRMIAGLEKPSAGNIVIGGRTVYSKKEGITVPPAKRDVGLIFQDYALWPHMNVAANVGFGLEVRRVGKAARRERVDAILERVQLTGLGDRMPGELSGGQQQRVAMARMLVVEPSVLLMDEPLSNLDAKLRLSMRSELKQLHREIGATTVYVTHDQREALEMSDMVTVMHEGRIQQTASPTELYERPASLFVAGFVGSPSMNLLGGVVRGSSGRQLEIDVVGLGNLTLKLEGEARCEPGRKVAVGYRPEDLGLLPESAGASAASGVAKTVLPAGSETIVEVDVGGAVLTVRVDRRTRLEASSRVRIDLARAPAHVFDRSTGSVIGRSMP
jgi:ABC-type sugar transport system ATPase subunit